MSLIIPSFTGGRKVAGTASWACGQIQGEEEISFAEDNLGRRAEDSLLQRKDPESTAGVVPSRWDQD